MMRISKDYDERKNEILDTAERLFHTKGYEKCTINDILNEVGIAKGTFYYYFKSKQEVLDAVVSRYSEFIINRCEKVLRKDITPVEKLIRLFLSMRINNEVGGDVLEEMHKPENALLHQQTLKEIVVVMAPFLVQVIEEGMDKKVWKCKYPLEYMQIFLASSITLTDEGIFDVDADSQQRILVALISLLEKMLDVPEDSFLQLFNENWG
ncbi:transcriptional regulator, TetR family [Gracilibacillus ureilyticus]|uniref:Transcriptional regulator, TetR family n=1 Tax=Gracilibacillus ureilyticus TaxID=531814 RepID=A0A1H9MJ31_9BACI|nr:TetR/AcrR family transcriptional regulator [Gracilibacillus ureilyticus]SER23702.1 transcriptional regulator, TetR family [Gracilibacillus ureilyticus]